MNNNIHIAGAREHNLKNIDVDIPRDKLVVITGLSGSGKSSLAFDTIYAEGQRRYMESLSSYARQFLGRMEKPDVDHIEGLSPAISIDQKTTSKNPRSTVGTVTEIYDYLRLLYARTGIPHCPVCGREVHQQTIDQIVDSIMCLPEGTRFLVLSPVVRGRKGEYTKQLDDYRKQGYVRARIDGEVRELSESIRLNRNQKHNIDIVIDRLVIRDGLQRRLTDSLEAAIKLGDGIAMIAPTEGEETMYSVKFSCSHCGVNIEEYTPRTFSFNSPFGACPTCTGLGTLMKIDPQLVVPDPSKSIRQGAITAMGWTAKDNSYVMMMLDALANKYDFSLDVPFEKLPQKIKDILFYGTGEERITVDYTREFGSGSFSNTFEGIINSLERRYTQTDSQYARESYEAYMSNIPCPDCHGRRLSKEALAVTVGGLNIAELTEMSIGNILGFFNQLELSEVNAMIAKQILKELHDRLGFLMNVGLDYLSLSREAGTLSGGEAQRIRLATQIGSKLMGVLYILDEPSIGLHQRDNNRLLETLKGLRDLGNTLLVVEHDEETMLSADYIIDIGPGPGIHGGHLVAAGTPQQILEHPTSITGEYLSGRKFIPVPGQRRKPDGRYLTVRGARQNNLKNIDVSFPLGVMTCVTGVSGSGKSTLVNEILHKTLARDLNRAMTRPGEYDAIEGLEYLDKVVNIDQSPIGRTPRSNPATYTGVFSLIRSLMASTADAKARGYNAGRFSFNVKGGRCEACAGDGIIKIEMHFLPDVYVPCEVCGGMRYNRETLEVRFKGKNIYEIMEMTVEESVEFFSSIPKIKRILQTLYDVGLGYIKIGQPSTQLSGGEAQRVKLATELAKRDTGKTIYILDEPTTGLHIADVDKLVGVLQKLVGNGNSIIIIEHNLDVIKTCDYIIDLGPEGGDKGGTIVCCGTPEQVAEVDSSYTGQYLKKVLKH